MKKRICDAAAEVLRETNNPAVMAGDVGLLHMIAERAGLGHNGPATEQQVLNALGKTPGELVPRRTRGFRNRLVRIFRLPEDVAKDTTPPQ